jgi:AP-1 complex subunit mu
MVASAIFLMDTKGKVIIARNYRGDIPMSVAERSVHLQLTSDASMLIPVTCRFSLYIQEKDEMELRPVFTDEGITFIYIKV